MLELRALCKQWVAPAGTTVPLLQGVDLQVRRGETVAILGPSGSGKSTLLKIVAGLEPADSGSVYWDGADLDGVPPERRHFALLFQDFALFPHLSVVDNVAFGLVEQGQRRGAARAQATAVLARFGLEARVADRVTQLSGGEQQRVALARALVTQPRVLLLDEPFSALDAVLRQRLRDEFRQRIAQGGMAALLVTHDESEAQAMAQRTFRLEAGRLVAVGA